MTKCYILLILSIVNLILFVMGKFCGSLSCYKNSPVKLHNISIIKNKQIRTMIM